MAVEWRGLGKLGIYCSIYRICNVMQFMLMLYISVPKLILVLECGSLVFWKLRKEGGARGWAVGRLGSEGAIGQMPVN